MTEPQETELSISLTVLPLKGSSEILEQAVTGKVMYNSEADPLDQFLMT